MSLNLKDIGCDMYTASPHKWLQAPKGTGFLFVRTAVQDRLWNTIATEGWESLELFRFHRAAEICCLSVNQGFRVSVHCHGLRSLTDVQ